MRPRLALPMLAALALLGATACSRAMRPTPAAVPAGIAQAGAPEGAGGIAVAASADERALVRRAAVELESDDPARVAARTDSLARALGGFVVQSTVTTDRALRDRRASLVARVPTPALGAALDAIGGFAAERSRTSNSEDVTERMIDLEAHVANLRASRDRMRALLERATVLSDVLTMERELARAQTALDAAEGRLEYLRGATSFAELTVTASPAVRLGIVSATVAAIGRAVAWLFVR